MSAGSAHYRTDMQSHLISPCKGNDTETAGSAQGKDVYIQESEINKNGRKMSAGMEIMRVSELDRRDVLKRADGCIT